MGTWTGRLQKTAVSAAGAYARAAAEVVSETLWPARCAVCGTLGSVLCEPCRASLPYIDQWRACPRCGAPWGVHQCTECNSLSLGGLGRDALPYQGCVCAVTFPGAPERICRTRKDQGERALAVPMGFAIACAVPPEWMDGLHVTFVPSTRRARAERGFCHAEDLAREVAGLLGRPCTDMLDAASSADQRHLGRTQRAQNVEGRFAAKGVCARVLLVDDVYTTGSTACAAADALHAAGAREVYVATFARV